jgi:hypothetical protein
MNSKYKNGLLTSKQIQYELDISSSTLSRLVSSASISYIKQGKARNSKRLFLVNDVVEFIFDNYFKSYQQ